MSEWKPRPLEEITWRYILKTLKYWKGNRTKAAKSLRISVRSLRVRLNVMREIGLEVEPSNRLTAPRVTLQCFYCQRAFEMLSSEYNRRVKRGQKRFYCQSGHKHRVAIGNLKNQQKRNDHATTNPSSN